MSRPDEPLPALPEACLCAAGPRPWRGMVLASLLTLAACGSGSGGGSGGTPPAPPAQPSALDTELRTLARVDLDLTGDPAVSRGLARKRPADDPLVKLGQMLFFSQTLAAGYDVSCGTCHHTDFAGSDGLSLPVGVVPKNAAVIGPGREVDAARDLDPSADGGPNMHRNSITTFNAALFDRSLMHDGRVFVLDEETVAGGHGQRIRTPESGLTNDLNALEGLQQFAVKGPIVNDNEMRGFAYTGYSTPAAYRQHLVQRLRGEVDTQYNPKADGPANWLALFRAGFGQPQAAANEVITILNVQRALAAFVDAQIFVETPWREYLEGTLTAISEDAKQGARLFLKAKADGGLGCAGCHAGDRFTDEAFHNAGFPQIGRGFGRADHTDPGRWGVTRVEEDIGTFRTPILLNVARTAPYGHAGTFQTLEELLQYHADPRRAVDNFDFSLAQLQQFSGGGVSYPYAEGHTRAAIALPSFDTAEASLPVRVLSATEVRQLVAFLNALTDDCVAEPSCIGQWTPQAVDDPDGHTVIRDQSQGNPTDVDTDRPGDYPQQLPLSFPATPARPVFADVQSCTNRLATHNNTGQSVFTRREEESFGLTHDHGYSAETWFSQHQSTLEIAMIGGGVSGAYLDADCWPDLIFTGGASSGMRFYRNAQGMGFEDVAMLAGDAEREFSGAAIVDLNGDYRRELLFGNIKPGEVPVYGQDGAGQYAKVGALPMVRPTFGMSFAPLDGSGYPYLFLAHWSGGTGTSGTSPALWKNDGAELRPWDGPGRTSSAFVDQSFNFTPSFADFTGDGRLDLAVVSDFQTSATLRNVDDGQGGWYFDNQTDRSAITDQNGMGSALLDIDNDGNLEWFVTSVFDPTGVPAGNWGVSGNRLYRSASTAGRIAFTDITEQAGVRHGYWGWGACAGDFDNDGFVDIFHVNGFGYIPDTVVTDDDTFVQQGYYRQVTGEQFQGKSSRLFINNGNGTFSERATAWGIDAPSEGRGVVCLDYDRDGDLDITVFDHSQGLQFFENRSGSGVGRGFINVRLVGAPPNTDAIGAKVFVTADVGNGHGVQTQLRLGEANSNFNSQNLPDLHFGLGQAAMIDRIRVVWPGGAELVCTNVPANRFVVLDQRLGQAACPAP